MPTRPKWGAVRLHLNDLNGQDPILGASGYLLEEMVAGALAELLIGVRRDPIYWVTMTLGFGGVLAELLADTVTVILPATDLSLRGASNFASLANFDRLSR